MLQSACYRKGNATCLTCHTAPHEAKRKAELRDEPDNNLQELPQGPRGGSLASLREGDVRGVPHAAGLCSGVLDKFADYSIDIPAASLAPSERVRHVPRRQAARQARRG